MNINLLTKEKALDILLRFGCRNEEEKDWTKQQIDYLIKNERNSFYEIALNENEILKLIPNECQSSEKVQDIELKILQTGWNSESYLFLRDINPEECGLYYVENGKHRIQALKNLLSKNAICNVFVRAIALVRSVNT